VGLELDSIGPGEDPVTGATGHGNKSSGFIREKGILDQLKEYQFLCFIEFGNRSLKAEKCLVFCSRFF
jgi:hypothetical protein